MTNVIFTFDMHSSPVHYKTIWFENKAYVSIRNSTYEGRVMSVFLYQKFYGNKKILSNIMISLDIVFSLEVLLSLEMCYRDHNQFKLLFCSHKNIGVQSTTFQFKLVAGEISPTVVWSVWLLPKDHHALFL